MLMSPSSGHTSWKPMRPPLMLLQVTQRHRIGVSQPSGEKSRVHRKWMLKIFSVQLFFFFCVG